MVMLGWFYIIFIACIYHEHSIVESLSQLHSICQPVFHMQENSFSLLHLFICISTHIEFHVDGQLDLSFVLRLLQIMELKIVDMLNALLVNYKNVLFSFWSLKNMAQIVIIVLNKASAPSCI